MFLHLAFQQPAQSITYTLKIRTNQISFPIICSDVEEYPTGTGILKWTAVAVESGSKYHTVGPGRNFTYLF